MTSRAVDQRFLCVCYCTNASTGTDLRHSTFRHGMTRSVTSVTRMPRSATHTVLIGAQALCAPITLRYALSTGDVHTQHKGWVLMRYTMDDIIFGLSGWIELRLLVCLWPNISVLTSPGLSAPWGPLQIVFYIFFFAAGLGNEQSNRLCHQCLLQHECMGHDLGQSRVPGVQLLTPVRQCPFVCQSIETVLSYKICSSAPYWLFH